MSTKKPISASTPVVKKTEKPAIKKLVDQSSIPSLLEEIDQLSILRKNYTKLIAKKEALEQAQKMMIALSKKSKDKFESEHDNFPFEIVLVDENKPGNDRRLFAINQVSTVTMFTTHLLIEINEVIKSYEAQIEANFKKMNR